MARPRWARPTRTAIPMTCLLLALPNEGAWRVGLDSDAVMKFACASLWPRALPMVIFVIMVQYSIPGFSALSRLRC